MHNEIVKEITTKDIFKDRKDNCLVLDFHKLTELLKYYIGNNNHMNLSYFLEYHDTANFDRGNSETLLINKKFVYYLEYKFSTKGYYYQVIRISTYSTHKTWSDEGHKRGYSLKKCIDFLVKNKLVIDDMNGVVNNGQ